MALENVQILHFMSFFLDFGFWVLDAVAVVIISKFVTDSLQIQFYLQFWLVYP